MELLLGSHVREHGARVGRLAGFELEPVDGRIRRIIISPNGELGPQAVTRPVPAISHVHGNGEIELRADIDTPPLPAVSDVMLLSRATRLFRDRHDAGRLVGLEVNIADRGLLTVLGRTHWWSRRVSLDATGVDCSNPGELRARVNRDTRAA